MERCRSGLSSRFRKPVCPLRVPRVRIPPSPLRRTETLQSPKIREVAASCRPSSPAIEEADTMSAFSHKHFRPHLESDAPNHYRLQPSLAHTDCLKSHSIVSEEIFSISLVKENKQKMSIFVLTDSGDTINLICAACELQHARVMSRLRMWGGCGLQESTCPDRRAVAE